MATFKSLIDAVNSLTGTTAIPPAALGTAPSPTFIAGDSVTVPVGGFSGIYAFGDSLSDAGNVGFLWRGLEPTSPYSAGRFTNGDVWVQDLARNLGMPSVKASLTGGTDYAYGGAETGNNPQHAAAPIDLPAQLAQFDLNTPSPSPNALYTVWAGSNDVLSIADSNESPTQQQASIQQAATNEATMIKGLVAHGARNLVVLDVPDISKSPSGLATPATAPIKSQLAQTFNADLGTALQGIMASGAAKIDYIDTFGLLDAAIANPGAAGLTNVTQPVWTGGYTDANSGTLNAAGAAQSGYLFFDGLHPTATGHTLLANSVTQTLTGTA